MSGLRIIVAVIAFWFALPALAATTGSVVFACNYTISISIDGADFEVSNRDRVRNGSAIPFHLQDYVLELRFKDRQDDTVSIALVLLEEAESGAPIEVYPSPPTFIAKLGEPTQFRHSDAIAKFDVSLIVSKTP